jgi:hypothetical protein
MLATSNKYVFYYLLLWLLNETLFFMNEFDSLMIS